MTLWFIKLTYFLFWKETRPGIYFISHSKHTDFGIQRLLITVVEGNDFFILIFESNTYNKWPKCRVSSAFKEMVHVVQSVFSGLNMHWDCSHN